MLTNVPFYQDLTDAEKLLLRRRGLVLATLANVFLVALIASYALTAWRDLRTLAKANAIQITLSGEGKVSAKPDVARFTASVISEGEALAAVQEESSRRSNAVVAFLKSQGIAEKDVKTVSYHLSPAYYYPPPCAPSPLSVLCPPEKTAPRIIGYSLRNALEVTVRDLGKAATLLGGVVEAGANQVGSVTFTIDQPEALKAEARKKAIDEANTKARELAKSLGRRLGRIVNFSESGGVPPPIIFGRAEAFGKGGGFGGEAPPPAVLPGENEVTVTVSVTYEFR